MNFDNIYNKPGIYKLTNQVDGKIYVGKSMSLRNRIRHHKNHHGHQYISNAIKKYGWDNFKVEILEEFENVDNIELLALETAYIEYYNSTDLTIGYNICLFASDGTGRKNSIETKKKMSNSSPKYWLGKKLSKEHKKNLSLSRIGKKRNPEAIQKISKQIKQIDIKTGEVIKIWKSLGEAGRFLGHENKRNNISAVCNKRVHSKSGIQKTAYGFKWEFLNNEK